MPFRTCAVATATALLALSACASPGTPTGSSTAPATTTSPPTSQAPAPTSPPADVALVLLSFAPPTLSVRAGTEVVWRNDNDIDHTVTTGTYDVEPGTGLRTTESPNGLVDQRVARKGDTVRHTFTTPGTYPYYCSIHKGMHGSIVVTP